MCVFWSKLTNKQASKNAPNKRKKAVNFVALEVFTVNWINIGRDTEGVKALSWGWTEWYQNSFQLWIQLLWKHEQNVHLFPFSLDPPPMCSTMNAKSQWSRYWEKQGPWPISLQSLSRCAAVHPAESLACVMCMFPICSMEEVPTS